MSAEAKILFWWLMFGGTHVLGSTLPVRQRLVRALGVPGFKGVYSLVSFATAIPLCYVYFSSRAAAPAFEPAPAWALLAYALTLLSFVFLAQAVATPSPLTTRAELTDDYPDRARGIQRVTRHPLNWGFMLLGLAHLGTNRWTGDWIFFGGLVVYGLISAAHQDRRLAATGPEAARSFQAQTSFWPFAAVLDGRQRLQLGELNVGALFVAIVLFALVRWVHPQVFGGFGA